jgi:hypothetical protein
MAALALTRIIACFADLAGRTGVHAGGCARGAARACNDSIARRADGGCVELAPSDECRGKSREQKSAPAIHFQTSSRTTAYAHGAMHSFYFLSWTKG